ncbi:hypothetical protein BT63DRAFT_451000 [Microthyrium microscopicum]|uniref:F-box domain-containing protein n=1 Tax=Microthyrium microscopicum TaxID=703497 RepID=A0A6A6UND7_9PEZI|nr:hypothetical protein BT63DRAFT_451000 [Microthyrium microscopicum]
MSLLQRICNILWPHGYTHRYQRIPDPDPDLSTGTSPVPGLLSLPAEILVDITSQLSPVSEAVLSLTCRALCEKLGTDCWRRLRGRNNLSDDTTRIDTLCLLHLLQRDAPQRYWICATCVCLHPYQYVPQAGDGDFVLGGDPLGYDPRVRPGNDCNAVPHGMVKSYLRFYLLPYLRSHYETSQPKECVLSPLKNLSWSGMQGLPHIDIAEHIWKRSIGNPSYLGLVKVTTRIFRSKAIVLRYYKYRAANESWSHSKIALDVCPHHMLASTSEKREDIQLDLKPGWDPLELSSDGLQHAVQLPTDYTVGTAYAARCTQCATQIHWTCERGPSEIVEPPFTRQPFVAVVVAHTYDGHASTHTRHESPSGPHCDFPKLPSADTLWAKETKPRLVYEGDAENAEIRQQIRSEMADFFGLHFSWQVGWGLEQDLTLIDVEEVHHREHNLNDSSWPLRSRTIRPDYDRETGGLRHHTINRSGHLTEGVEI